ncbi:hypothetical protein EON65_53210 [archaeon]|nr:MAG: hypothetical protein EON65_53210 [archaeon]
MQKTIEFSDDTPDDYKLGELRGSIDTLDGSQEETALIAPQIMRTPVFAGKNEKEGISSPTRYRYPPPPSSAPGGMRSPVRPSSTKPSSRSGKRSVSVENRVLIKLASALPQDDNDPNGLGRLPESRATLVKLNGELDGIVNEIRLMEAAQNRFSFSMSLESALPSDRSVLNMDHGVAMYDAIISDLSEQAFKKVGRIKLFYSKFIARQRLDHEEEVSQLQLRIQQLEAQAHESLLYQPDQSIGSPQMEATCKKRSKSINITDVEEEEAPASPLMCTSPKAASTKAISSKAVVNSPTATKNLHSFVLNRLDTERNVSVAMIIDIYVSKVKYLVLMLKIS